MSKKNIIIIIIALILIIILGVNLNKKNNSTSEEIQSEETINQVSTKKTNGIFEIYNTDITKDSGSTKITATIKNISGNKTEEQKINLVLIDTKGKEIGKLIVTVPSLESGKSTLISAESLTVYENIYDFIIK